jgi:hypothetical protein
MKRTCTLPTSRSLDWQHRSHFFCGFRNAHAQDPGGRARRRNAAKRGGRDGMVNVDEVADVSMKRSAELGALDNALTTLADDRERPASLELRSFAALDVDVKETAAVVGVSPELSCGIGESPKPGYTKSSRLRIIPVTAANERSRPWAPGKFPPEPSP